MKHSALLAVGLLAILLITSVGCARAARDTSGFALREQTVVNAPFEDTWHAVKHVLREQGYDIYTRDKRGAFVAYTPMQRALWLQPRRTKFTIEMARKAPEETAVSVESVRQVYGVTLLTHPNWHDREQRDPEASLAILDSIRIALDEDVVSAEPFLDDDADTPTPVDEAPAVEEVPTVEATPLPPEEMPAIQDAETVD